jgi:hypothetical protein
LLRHKAAIIQASKSAQARVSRIVGRTVPTRASYSLFKDIDTMRKIILAAAIAGAAFSLSACSEKTEDATSEAADSAAADAAANADAAAGAVTDAATDAAAATSEAVDGDTTAATTTTTETTTTAAQ